MWLRTGWRLNGPFGNDASTSSMRSSVTSRSSQNHELNPPKTELMLERVVDVRPELVWKAWTTPEYLMKWFTPLPWKIVECEINLVPRPD